MNIAALTALHDKAREYEAAGEALAAATAKAYPIGTLVEVNLHRHLIIGEVVGHSAGNSRNPAEVRIVNVRTQKRRYFNAANPDYYRPVILPLTDASATHNPKPDPADATS